VKVVALGSIAVAWTLYVVAALVSGTDSPPTFQTGANMAQLISIISLPLAAWAIVSAKRDLVTERRLRFELDTLRGLADSGSRERERWRGGRSGDGFRNSRATPVHPWKRRSTAAPCGRLCRPDPAGPGRVQGPVARTLPTWTTGLNRGWRYVALVDVRPQTLRMEVPSSHRAPGEPLAAPPAVRRGTGSRRDRRAVPFSRR